MSGPTALLNTGNSALRATQACIQVTGNNIANVNTTGYNRQSVVLTDGIYVNTFTGQVGTGVVAQEVVRAHDKFIEGQYLTQASARDRFQTLYNGLTGVQNLVNESNTDGVNTSLSTMFGDWGDLTTNPDSEAARQTMLDDTETLLSRIRATADSMSQLETQANQSIEDGVATLNSLAKEIAELNRQINNTEIDGKSIPNNLYDLRDTKVRELASLVDVNVIDNGKGNFIVNTKAGQTIVDGVVPFEFKFEQGKTVRQLSPTSIAAGGSDVQAYYEGSDSNEYTLKVVTGGAVGSGAAFQVSLDGGKTWLANDDGTTAVYSADTISGKVAVGDLNIYFGSTSDPNQSPVSNLNVGDTFTLVPKKALYWYTTAGTPVNVTPQKFSDGSDNATRLTGGSLAGAFEFRDEDLGNYQASLDAMANSMIWEINRIHSQGAGLTNFSTVQGTYSVASSSTILGSPSSGLAYGGRLQSGAAMIYVYDANGDVASSASITIDPSTDSLDDVVNKINAAFGGLITADVVNNQLSISGNAGNTFQFGDDSAGIWAALGINTLLTGSNASDIAVNSVVANDLNRVSAGHVDASGLMSVGDNTTATAMASLETSQVSFRITGQAASSQTLSDFYASLVGKIGSATSNASYQATYQTALAAQLEDQQLSTSGVSLDEELTNLIKFQHSYQAAAKLISTADKLFETVLGLKN